MILRVPWYLPLKEDLKGRVEAPNEFALLFRLEKISTVHVKPKNLIVFYLLIFGPLRLFAEDLTNIFHWLRAHGVSSATLSGFERSNAYEERLKAHFTQLQLEALSHSGDGVKQEQLLVNPLNGLVYRSDGVSVYNQIVAQSHNLDARQLTEMSELLFQTILEKEIFWTSAYFEMASLKAKESQSQDASFLDKVAKINHDYSRFIELAQASRSGFDELALAKSEERMAYAAQSMNQFNSLHRSVVNQARKIAKIAQGNNPESDIQLFSEREKLDFLEMIKANGNYMQRVAQLKMQLAQRQGVEFEFDENIISGFQRLEEFLFVISRHGTGFESGILAGELLRILDKFALLFAPFRFVSGMTSDLDEGRIFAEAMENHLLTVSVGKELSAYKEEGKSPSIFAQFKKILEANARGLLAFPEGRLSNMFGSISTFSPGALRIASLLERMIKTKVRIRVVSARLPNFGYHFGKRVGKVRVEGIEVDPSKLYDMSLSDPSRAASLIEFLFALHDAQDSSRGVFGSLTPAEIARQFSVDFQIPFDHLPEVGACGLSFVSQ